MKVYNILLIMLSAFAGASSAGASTVEALNGLTDNNGRKLEIDSFMDQVISEFPEMHQRILQQDIKCKSKCRPQERPSAKNAKQCLSIVSQP